MKELEALLNTKFTLETTAVAQKNHLEKELQED
jgi:hypothetical protein